MIGKRRELDSWPWNGNEGSDARNEVKGEQTRTWQPDVFSFVKEESIIMDTLSLNEYKMAQ